MTRIGLFSDTHGYLDPRVAEHFVQCDEIWHAGDIGSIALEDAFPGKKLRAVYGNVDDHKMRRMFPKDQHFQVEGLRIWMTHIGGYPGRYSSDVRQQLNINPPDVFVCGHSHILRVMRDKRYGHMVMNPGAAGIHGFHKVRTLLRFIIDGKSIGDLEAIELGLRGRPATLAGAIA